MVKGHRVDSWEDVAIDLMSIDHKRLLAQWAWLLGGRHLEPIGMSSFGDWFLQDASGAVHFLDVVGGQLHMVARSRTSFDELATLPENLNEWFMAELVHLLRESQVLLQEGECYGFKLPPCVGGEVAPNNIEPTTHMLHQAIMSQTAEQSRKLPPGTRISRFTVK
jgi:hypothetical protein